MRPFTFAPTVRWPTSVWTAYAKSIGVAPDGSTFTSPLGVKTYTSSAKRSVRRLRMYSPGSCSSACPSMRDLTHVIHSSSVFAARPRLRSDHGRVQRAIAIELRHRDEVLEAPRHRLPERVDEAERRVAVARPLLTFALADDPHRGQVVDLVELPAALGHLVVDRVEVLRSRG